MIHAPNPLIATGVVASTAATDAVYVLFTAAVAARRRSVAASWSSVWYLLSAFAVISYTGNPIYVFEIESLNSLIGRQMVVGTNVMVARVLLQKGARVPLHSHHNEQAA